MKEVFVFIDDHCPSCEKVVEMMNELADVTLHVRTVHRRQEPALSARFNVQIVPALFVNGTPWFYGEFTREEFQHKLKKFLSTCLD